MTKYGTRTARLLPVHREHIILTNCLNLVVSSQRSRCEKRGLTRSSAVTRKKMLELSDWLPLDIFLGRDTFALVDAGATSTRDCGLRIAGPSPLRTCHMRQSF